MKVYEFRSDYDTDHLTPDELAELDVLFPPASHPIVIRPETGDLVALT